MGRRRCGGPLRKLIVLVALLAAGSPGAAADRKGPLVAAASDLTFALDAIAERFTRETGEPVRLVFGSSGQLARQVMHGAGFELFLSADEAFVHRLADAGLTRDRGVLYAVGRLVVFAPHGSPLRVDGSLEGLADLAAQGRLTTFAIANPEHAPYGRAAEAALRARGLWDAVRPALVLGENISQAAQFATTGDAAGGLIAYSLALSPALSARGRYALVPESFHPPLRQRMVLTKAAGPAAGRFYEYLQQEEARELFRRYGFVLPDEG